MALTSEQLEVQRLRMRDYRKRKKREMGKRAFLKEQRENKQDYRDTLRDNASPNIFQNPTVPKKYSDMLKGLSKAVAEALQKISKGTMSTSEANVILPQLKEKIEMAPDDLVMIGSQKNCEDLVEDIVENNTKRIVDDPRLENVLPTPSVVEKQIDRVNALWRFMNNLPCKKNDCQQNCLDYEWTRDTEKVIKYVMNRYDKPNSRNASFTGLSSTLRNLSGFEKEHSIYSKMSSAVYQEDILPAQKENKLSVAQKKNYVAYGVLLKNRKKLKIGSLEGAVVSMYMDAPPRRVRDYYLMKIHKEVKSKTRGKQKLIPIKSVNLDKKYNYLVLDNLGGVKEMVFNVYKTQKDFGQQVIVPDKKEMNKYIKPYLKNIGLKSGDFLFPAKTGLSLGDRFGALVKKSFGLISPGKMSPTAGLLRHSFVSYIRKEFSNKPDSFFETIATKMAHSYSTSLAYRVLEDA